MKTLLLTEGAQGQARSYLAKRMLESVAAKLDITLLDAAQDAELIIVIGDEQPRIPHSTANACLLAVLRKRFVNRKRF